MSARGARGGKLVLADGTRFEGRLIGAGALPVLGEVVFNTSMTGYQEILTDPSYAGQIIVMTYPQIGNYGVHIGDNEKRFCSARGLVVRELSPFYSPGPGRRSLDEFMMENGVRGLSEVDTRRLALRIRSEGAIPGAIGSEDHSDEQLVEFVRSRHPSEGQGLVHRVSVAGSMRFPGQRGRAAVIDLGAKESIVTSIRRLGVETEVFGTTSRTGDFPADRILQEDFDFVVLSNGPGDPADIPGAVASVAKLLGRLPILGICLGHQITALALGGGTFKLKFGHRGANQPVICHRSHRVLITSQNHGFAVRDDLEALSPGIEITYSNLNDGTIEGFADTDRMIHCIQFHPEASPGPHDTSFIFKEFSENVTSGRTDRRHHEDDTQEEVKNAQAV